MGRYKKITWDVIYDDFKKEYPKLKPYDYATILIFFLDRVRMTYNYDMKEVTKYRVLTFTRYLGDSFFYPFFSMFLTFIGKLSS